MEKEIKKNKFEERGGEITVNYHDRRFDDSWGKIRIDKFKNFQGYFNNDRKRKWLEDLGLESEDLISDISQFWPSGFNNKLPLEEGLGQKFLDKMFKDSEENKAKVILCTTNKVGMKGLLKKNSFLHFEKDIQRANFFYKIL